VPLLLAAAYGLLATLAFALVPLARARTVPAATLLRGGVEGALKAPWWSRALSLVAGALIASLALWTAPNRGFALGFILAALGLLALLGLLAALIRWALASLPRPRSPLLRLALANLHRPGAPTARLVVALGLGFTLFATMAVVETNLSAQIRSTIPARAPSFFILDVPSSRAEEFRRIAAAAAPGAELNLMPSLRATVSLDAENARAAGLGVGDSITVSVLGREIEARIANLREVDWGRMGVNFVIVFAPGALDEAPHSLMGTATMPTEQERGFARAVAQGFPSVSAVRIQDVIATVSNLMGQLAAAIRAAGSVAILVGLAVLVGALAASRRARIYDSVLLKLLGATRARILAVQAAEFALLAFILCLLALALGAAGGWYIVVELFELEWAPDWGVVLLTLGAGAAVTLVIGLVGSLPALAARPAQALRAL
jgi:putative ABC transport system permease protein